MTVTNDYTAPERAASSPASSRVIRCMLSSRFLVLILTFVDARDGGRLEMVSLCGTSCLSGSLVERYHLLIRLDSLKTPFRFSCCVINSEIGRFILCVIQISSSGVS